MNAATSYVSEPNRHRLKTVESLSHSWAYPLIAITLALHALYQLRLTLRAGETNTEALLGFVDNGVKELFILSAVFMPHKMAQSLYSFQRALSVRENALHNTLLYDASENSQKIVKLDDQRVLWKSLSHATNLAATAMLGYAAYRFAIGDPNKAFDNLGLLAASAAIEFLSKTFGLCSEQKRCESMLPHEKHMAASGVSSTHLMMTGLAFALMGASAAMGNYASNHPNYAYSLTSAALAFAGLASFASLPEMLGHRLTEKAVDQKMLVPDMLALILFVVGAALVLCD